jgi:hypothetical protein
MKRYTLKMYKDDMGSFTQHGVTSLEDALWHVNSARAHDGLKPIEIDELKRLKRGTDKGWLKLNPQN